MTRPQMGADRLAFGALPSAAKSFCHNFHANVFECFAWHDREISSASEIV
jgi:hypothetical protein